MTNADVLQSKIQVIQNMAHRSSMQARYTVVQELRSASQGDLVVPSADTTRFGRRGFSVSGPAIWNSLPQEVRQTMNNVELFKKKLKTFYMQKQH